MCPVSFGLQILIDGPFQVTHSFHAQGIFRLGYPARPPRFHLHKYQFVLVSGDDVDLSTLHPDVAIDDSVPLAPEVVAHVRLAERAQRLTKAVGLRALPRDVFGNTAGQLPLH